jgi:5,10-methylenetetrahydromethanopterin reductase
VAKAIEMFSPEMAEKLSVAGTPEECAEQIRRDILPAGINHIILALADAPLVQFFSGRTIEGVPPITTQLRMVAERMIPAFA